MKKKINKSAIKSYEIKLKKIEQIKQSKKKKRKNK